MNKGTVTALILGLLIVLLFVVSLFYGTVHFTPAGYRLIGDLLFDAIMEYR